MTRSRKRKLQRLHGRPSAIRMLAASVPTLLAGMSAYAQTTSGGLEEIVVTAQKRTEDLQSVPVSIQAFSTQRLQELNIQRFDDYVRFMPSVSYQTLGPGFAAVYMRGVASGGDGNHSGSLPSVGIYLDEQPITTIQGALDVHLYDIQRVEALAGPQGTLYGASSQAGTLRIITNRPDASAFDASYGLEVNSVDGGGIGYLAEGMVNLPINDRTAVRLVGWHRHDAGYIDNVYRERTFPTSGITVNNARFVERQLQRSRHHRRPRGTAARPQRQLDHHPAGHGPEAGNRRQLGLRHFRRRSQAGAQSSRTVGRSLGAGRAHRRRQGREPRPGLRRFVPQARRRHGIGLLRLLVLVRHPLRLRRVLVRRQRRPDRPVAVHPGQGSLQPLYARTAHLVRREPALPLRRRPVLPAAGARHPAALQDRQPRIADQRDGLGGHDLADQAAARRQGLRRVRRVHLRLHRPAVGHDRRPLLRVRQLAEGLLRLQRQATAAAPARRPARAATPPQRRISTARPARSSTRPRRKMA